ncbi:MAG TPA: M3 family metallopeptidase, partial [Paracoccus sp.]|nr:M3 family metallopeptidase [Paracoccus sp. (in: a-proteobacteria)]
MSNPFLVDWGGPFALPPFEVIRDQDFAPAFDAALAEGRAAVAAIAENPMPADFANTIEALELADGLLDRVAGVFFNLAGSDSTPAREALSRDLAPKLSAYASEITANRALFARIEDLWSRRVDLELTAEQARVLMLYRRMFIRAGARLDDAGSARMAAIKGRLASLGTQFTQNLLADERDWYMPLDDLAGLPEFLIASVATAARERGQDGHVITLSRSLIVPFLQYSHRRDLRRRAYEAWVARGARGGETDNRAIAAETLALRAERASLLGYASFADYKLETEMARTPQAVRDLLMRVWEPARRAALADAQAMEALLLADGQPAPLRPWDWRYYAEKRRQELHDFDEAALKPYLPLDAMVAAAFDVARRLFRLEFRPLDVPLHHPDARAWEVTREGQHMAVFIGDYFARSSKRSGAWCSTMRSQRKLGGEVRPIVVNVCNFARGDPALLSWDDARTLFHEFGHALHQILSDVTYGFISGTSVARDFVELPSQLYEHWLDVPEVTERHARHWQTGAPMPLDLRKKLKAASTWDQGFATVEYIASALVDLAFHEGPPPADPMQKQAEVLEGIGMPAAIRMRHATPHFAHVFSGD